MGRWTKSETERVVEAKLAGQSAKPLTAKQIVALQCKASDAKNKRRGR